MLVMDMGGMLPSCEEDLLTDTMYAVKAAAESSLKVRHFLLLSMQGPGIAAGSAENQVTSLLTPSSHNNYRTTPDKVYGITQLHISGEDHWPVARTKGVNDLRICRAQRAMGPGSDTQREHD
jgi:hypothetical protein